LGVFFDEFGDFFVEFAVLDYVFEIVFGEVGNGDEDVH
jgi:hypothetical protein